jgi:hypothetical protein
MILYYLVDESVRVGAPDKCQSSLLTLGHLPRHALRSLRLRGFAPLR